MPLPKGISDDDLELAGSFVLTYGTSLHASRIAARRSPAKPCWCSAPAVASAWPRSRSASCMGLRVIAAASSEDKRDAALAHGAETPSTTPREDLRERIKALTDGKGVDIVYDPVGGDFAEPALRSVGWRGRYLVVGFAAGDIPKIPINLLLLKGSSLVGVFWGEFVRREPAAECREHGDCCSPGCTSARSGR